MNKKGLTDKEVIESRKIYGSNMHTEKKKNTFFSLFIESLNDPIIKILLIALMIKIVFLFKESNIYETIGILVAVFLASFISTISEYSSEKAFEKLQEEASKIKCKVIRNDELKEINIEDIVVGDLISLCSGDKVPGDGKIIEGQLVLDESSLTGETKEKHKHVGDMVFKGSIVLSKKSIIRVTSVGDKTYFGSLALAVQEFSPESPLKLRLRALAKVISKIGYISALLVLISFLINKVLIENNFEINKIVNLLTNRQEFLSSLFYALTLSVTIIVVAVPEGLPMMITLVLSSNMKRMLKSGVLVRKLVGIETAGSLNVLFTDKTGTLTEGRLKVSHFFTPDFKEYDKVDSIRNINIKNYVKLCLFYNNESVFESDKIIGGNMTDKSILEYVGRINDKYEIIEKIEFDSKLKYSSTTINYNNETTLVKGAYEVLLDKCKFYLDEKGTKQEITNKESIKNKINRYANKGIRILSVCFSEDRKIENLTLLGFICLKDSIRASSIKGINLVKKAGINTIMITGDSKETAIGVANELKMLDGESVVLTSEELNKMSDDEIKRVLPNLKVVARSLPQDKSRLVMLSQELGLVTGMTGDGVNDAPALKKADVGFAMGSGTEVAKEVSDIIILDDNFMSISSSVLFGRTVFKSIRKFIIFQLTINFCAVFLSVVGPYIGVISPITVVQMLWVNMVMDTLAALAFSFEAPLIEYMEELPKSKNEPIMNKYMINQIIISGIYCSILCILFLKLPFVSSLYRIGTDNKYLMTAFFGLFIFLAIFNLFNARTHRINILANILKNKIFLLIILVITLIQIVLIYFGGTIFRTTGLTFIEFQIMIFLAFTVIPIDIIRKIILKLKRIKTKI